MKIKLLSFSILLIFITGLWSCGKEDNQVTIDIVSNQDFPKIGGSVELTVTASADIENLKSVKVEVSGVDTNGAALSLLSTTAETSELSYTGTFNFTAKEGLKVGEAIHVTVTVTDNLDGSFDKTYDKIYAVEYMKMYREGAVIGHQFGPLNGAYNLVNATEAYQTDPKNTKDIVDKSEQKKALSNTFWASAESNTQFIDLGKDFDVLSLHSFLAAETFSKRAPSTLITVSEGTKFLAKLRGGNDYAVVVIKTIEPTYEQTPTENKGRYTFDIYKLE